MFILRYIIRWPSLIQELKKIYREIERSDEAYTESAKTLSVIVHSLH